MQFRLISTFLVALALAAPSISAAAEPPRPTKIIEFNNPEGPKEWGERCSAPAKPDRLKIDVKNIRGAVLYPGCVEITGNDGQEHWVKETSVVHDGAKSSNTNVCERVAAGQGAGETVEAATMGMGGSGTGGCGK